MEEKTFITNISDIVALNTKNGGHFFDKDTVKYWRSRFYSVYPGGVFITSERNGDDTKRLYSVRRVNSKGSITTLSFQECNTLGKARTLAKRYCKENNLTEYEV